MTRSGITNNKSVLGLSALVSAILVIPTSWASEPMTQKQQVLSLIQRINDKYRKFEQSPQALDDAVVASIEKNSTELKNPEANAVSADVPTEAPTSLDMADISRYETGEELICSLQLADIPVNDLTLLKTESGYAIDLVMMLEVLNIYFDYHQQTSLIKGWIYNENNNFSVQLPKGSGDVTEVFISNRRFELNTASYTLLDDIVYVDLKQIEQWFGFKFELRETDLKLFLTTEKPLPLQLQMQRQKNKLSVGGSQSAVLPLKEAGYKTFTTPMLDLNLTSGVSVSGGHSYIPMSYSAAGALDIPYFSSLFYFNGIKGELLNNPRLTLSKYSNKSDLLGPLALTSIDVGDVTSVNSGDGSTTSQGMGIRLSSLSATQTGNDSTVNFSGVLQNGWDVELYRNNILIDRKLNVQDGRYDFNNVNLIYGPNSFDLVFYGPQGQVETRNEQYNFTENSLKKSDVSYLFSWIDNSKSLFDKTGIDDESQGYVTNGIVRYGITDFWTSSLGVQSFDPKNAEKKSLTSYNVGNTFSLFNKAIASHTVTVDTQENTSQTYSLSTGLAGLSLSGSISTVDLSESAKQAEGTINEPSSYSYGISGAFGQTLPLSFSNTWSESTDQFGNESSSISNLLALRTPIGVFNNLIQKSDRERLLDSNAPLLSLADQQLLNSANDDPFNPQTRIHVGDLAGQFNFSTAIKKVFLTLGTTYSIRPEKQIESVSTSMSYQIDPDINSTLGLSYSRFSEQLAVQLGLNWNHKLVSLSSFVNYNNQDSYSVGLSAGFSFGYEPQSSTFFGGSQPLAYGGALAVNVYEDLNNNNQREPNEPVIPNAKIKAVQQYREAVTDENGVAVLKGLSTGYATDIVVDRNSFDDPSLMPTTTGISILPRRGLVMHHEIPVASTGEIEGNIYIKSEVGEESPASNILVMLIDSKNNKVAETVTEFDGYYAFADILPGRYKIALNKRYTSRKGLRNTAPLLADVKGGGEIIDGRSFILEKMQFTEGYGVELGSFSTLALLKVYWGIVQPKLDTKLLYPFYLQDESSGRYVLYGHFVEMRERADRVCERFALRKFSCTVKPLGLDM